MLFFFLDCTAPFIVDVVTNGFADGKTATGTTMVNTVTQSRGKSHTQPILVLLGAHHRWRHYIVVVVSLTAEILVALRVFISLTWR